MYLKKGIHVVLLKVLLPLFVSKIEHVLATKTASLITDTSAELRIENLLTEFMTDLKSFNFEKLKPPRLVILGETPKILQSTKVLLQTGTPYIVNTKPETVTFPLHFGAESVVLFFIDGLNDFRMNSAFAQLPEDYKCRTLIISTKENTTDMSIATTILSAVKMNLRNVMVARLDGQVMRIYGRILQANCAQEITMVNKWTPGKGFVEKANVLGHDLALDERGCPNVVSTFEILPTMILREDEKKLLRIIGGVEGHLINTIAKYLNMELVVNVPFVEEKYRVSPDGTVTGIIGDVAREVANLGIGQIRPTPARAKIVDLTTSYGHECIVWTLPLVTKYTDNVVTSEFLPVTWVMVIISVILCCGLSYAGSKLKIGCRSPSSVFDVIAMTLNYTIPKPPTNLLCKLFFLLYLNYSRVISTAYSTSLSSILTATILEPTILDEDGILAAGLRTAGTQSSLSILSDQVSPNSTIAELINRYEVIKSPEEALARIANRQDIAYLRHYSTIDTVASKLHIAGKEVKFYSLPDCVISYHSVMVTPKGSRLTGEINHIMLRLQEAGIYNYWMSVTHVTRPPTIPQKPNNRTLSRLKSIFFLYFYCLVPAFLAFAAELVAFKLKLDWFTR